MSLRSKEFEDPSTELISNLLDTPDPTKVAFEGLDITGLGTPDPNTDPGGYRKFCAQFVAVCKRLDLDEGKKQSLVDHLIFKVNKGIYRESRDAIDVIEKLSRYPDFKDHLIIHISSPNNLPNTSE